MRLFDQSLADDRPVLEHVLQVDQVAVVFLLCKIVRVVEMDDPLLMSSNHFFRQQYTHCQILADLSRHIVALGGVDHRILVGVFLIYLFVEMLDEGQYPIVRGIGLSGKLTFITISYIFLCYFVAAHLHDSRLHHILDILYMGRMGHLGDLSRYIVCDCLDLIFVQLIDRCHLLVGSLDGIGDFKQIKRDLLTISFDYIYFYICLHRGLLSSFRSDFPGCQPHAAL